MGVLGLERIKLTEPLSALDAATAEERTIVNDHPKQRLGLRKRNKGH